MMNQYCCCMLFVASLLLVSAVVDGFLPTSTRSNIITRHASSADDSDFYADFDPNEWKYSGGGSGGGGGYNSDRRSSSGYSDRRSGGRDFGGRGGRSYNNDRRGGGRGGNNFRAYQRDPIDQSGVDVPTVEALIEERTQYRRNRQFQDADAVRDQLLHQHGVLVHDKEQVWRSGCTSGSEDWSFYSNNNRDNDRNNRQPRQPRDFGPKGHDYEKNGGDNVSGLSEEQIDALLAERLQHKLNRNYAESDAIQQQLKENGVYVHDGFKMWRADGESFDGLTGKQYRPVGGGIKKSSTIQALVDERSNAKYERNYQEADAIKDRLMKEFGVFVDDRKREWGLVNGSGGGGDRYEKNDRNSRNTQQQQPFTIAETSTVPDNFDEIQQLVEQRDQARSQRNFEVADRLRDELVDTHNIYMDDKMRQWWVVDANTQGDRNPKEMWQNAYDNYDRPLSKRDRPWTSSGSLKNISEEQQQEIFVLLMERDECKGVRDFDTADRIRDTLMEKYSIRIRDNHKEWFVINADYEMADDCSLEDEALIHTITDLVRQRGQAKKDRDYDLADDIRDQLDAEYGVQIDDKIKEWTIPAQQRRFRDDLGTFSTPASSGVRASPADDEQEEEDDEEPLMAVEEVGAFEEEEETEMKTEEDVEELMALTVIQLKAKLKEASLPVSGRKAELVDRLLQG